MPTSGRRGGLAQLGIHVNLLPRSDIQCAGARLGPRTGRPGIPDLTAKSPAARVLDRQLGIDRLTQPCCSIA
jgi:hypothetical protein